MRGAERGPIACGSSLLMVEEPKAASGSSGTTTSYLFPESCVHELFEAQARQTPVQSAVVYERQQLTYRELNERSNQLARRFASLGRRPERLSDRYRALA